MNIHVHFNSEQLNRIERKLDSMAATLDQVAQDMNDESTLIDGLSTLIQGLKDQVTAAKGDQAKIDAIFAQAEANKNKLATALAANTPAETSTTTAPPTP